MPVRPLPVELVERLKKAAPRIEKVLGRMKNIDPRRDKSTRTHFNEFDTEFWGGRVRQMNISRNFSDVEVVIKNHVLARKGLKKQGESHGQILVDEILAHVKLHNGPIARRLVNSGYELRAPYLYPISNNLIAMSKCGAPVLRDVFTYLIGGSAHLLPGEEEKVRAIWKQAAAAGLTKADLANAYLRFYKREQKILRQSNGPFFEFTQHRLFLSSVENRKFIFTPMADDA